MNTSTDGLLMYNFDVGLQGQPSLTPFNILCTVRSLAKKCWKKFGDACIIQKDFFITKLYVPFRVKFRIFASPLCRLTIVLSMFTSEGNRTVS
jgi:hypothetical protein